MKEIDVIDERIEVCTHRAVASAVKVNLPQATCLSLVQLAPPYPSDPLPGPRREPH